MATYRVALAEVASEGPIELFPDPRDVFEDWSDAHAARVLPVARFDLALVPDDDRRGTGVFVYYEDPRPSYLKWRMDGARVVGLEGWESLQPFQEMPSRDALVRWTGGERAELVHYEVEVPKVSEVGSIEWPGALERALVEAGASSPLGRLRLGGHPCYVQDGYVDDDVFVAAELPSAWLGLASRYFYLFARNGEVAQDMQLT